MSIKMINIISLAIFFVTSLSLQADVYDEFYISSRDIPSVVLSLTEKKLSEDDVCDPDLKPSDCTSLLKIRKTTHRLSPAQEFLLNAIISKQFSIENFKSFCQEQTKDASDTSSQGCLDNEDLTAPLPKIKLSLLQMLALVGDANAFEFLSSRKLTQKQINKTATIGWTIAHLAALRNENYLHRLEMMGASLSQKNNYNGTPQDVWDISHLLSLSDISIPLSLSLNQEPIFQTAQEFREETGTVFIERPKIKAINFFMMFWEDLHETHSEITLREKKFLTDHLTNNPHNLRIKNIDSNLAEKALSADIRNRGFVLQKTTHHSFGISYNLGFSLVANQPFNSFEILSFYEGSMIPLDSWPKDSTYSTVYADGTDIRGLSSFAQDCLPNAFLTAFTNYKGYPYIEVLVAVTEIKTRDLICWSYGPHSIKSYGYVNIKKQETDLAIKSSLESVLDILFTKKRPIVTEEEVLIEYLTKTPSVIFKSLFEEKITVSQFKKLLAVNRASSVVMPYPEWTQFVVVEFLNILEKLNPSIKKKILFFFIKKTEGFQLIEFLIALDSFNRNYLIITREGNTESLLSMLSINWEKATQETCNQYITIRPVDFELAMQLRPHCNDASLSLEQ